MSAIPALPARLHSLLSLLKQLFRLPRAALCFQVALNPAHVIATYHNFIRPHPTYRLFGRKTVGAALLDLDAFATPQHYLETIARRNFGGFFARRAKARGYRFASIDRNRHIDDIDAINHALPFRQGKIMAPSYRSRTEHFIDQANYRYYGVLDGQGRLMAYCEVGIYGNFALLSRLLGYRNNDGVMHFMIVEIASCLIAEGLVRYLMYDTWFGASEGLRKFKAILGFAPYRVRYALDYSTAARIAPQTHFQRAH